MTTPTFRISRCFKGVKSIGLERFKAGIRNLEHTLFWKKRFDRNHTQDTSPQIWFCPVHEVFGCERAQATGEKMTWRELEMVY